MLLILEEAAKGGLHGHAAKRAALACWLISDFPASVMSAEKRDQLEIALSGRGAFYRFKDTESREGIADEWYAFRDKSYMEFARDWCEVNEIPIPLNCQMIKTNPVTEGTVLFCQLLVDI